MSHLGGDLQSRAHKRQCTRPGPVIQSSFTARLRGVDFSLARHGLKS
jgi:hypothetical protein